ncbi:toprim domain-containing protein [Listeria monocytogenes]|nr:toprim domain-containing protein [Listeria monocytogenes]EII0397053.1 toprim domain-containing protein [Listeria monocytogenes]EIO8245496.1 toprim domain-containing protein [Listeria monocytogenes]EIS4452243.1 toprim domain-containing protein [Listeria monocytogenes]
MDEIKQNFKEKIVKAKNVDIVSFCEAVGYDLQQEKGNGTQFRGVDHGSLVVFRETNTFRWFKEEISGDAVNFVKLFFDKSTNEAMDLLLETASNGEFKEVKEFKKAPREPFRYIYNHDKSTEQVESYLIDERRIHPTIVETLIKKGLIRQSTYKGETDCLFVWGKSGKRVGVSVQGIVRNEEKYGFRGTKKRVGLNSEQDYGFNVSLGQPKNLYFFESPIDMLSYWSLHPELTDCRLIAMTGLQKKTVLNVLKHTLMSRTTQVYDINLAVDNDPAGQKFIDQFKDMGYEYAEGGALSFKPLIPDNNAIPKQNYEVYQQVAKEFQVPWELLASWHKAESNFDPEKGAANSMKVHTYFSVPASTKSKEKELLNLEPTVRQLAQDLVSVKENGKFALEKLIKEDRGTNVSAFIDKVRNIYKEYHEGKFVVKEEVLKDWNDLQKKHNPGQNVTRIPKLPKVVQRASANNQFFKNDRQQIVSVTKIEVSPDSTKKQYQAIMKDREKVIGHFEADSKEEMDKLIKVYGFEAMDKEDIRKYTSDETKKEKEAVISR